MTTGRKYVEKDGVIYCDRRGCPGSTGLRCQRTGVPICSKCAVRTPVGYISQDAAKEQADKYYNIDQISYAIAAVVAFVATFIMSLLVTLLGGFFFFFIIFLLAVPAGGLVSEMVWRSIRYRRGRYTGRVVGIAMVTAAFMVFLITFNFLVLIFGFFATSAAVSRFEIALRA